MEPPTKEQEIDDVDLILVFSSRVRTSIFRFSVFQSSKKEIRTSNAYIENERKKKKTCVDLYNVVLCIASNRQIESNIIREKSFLVKIRERNTCFIGKKLKHPVFSEEENGITLLITVT